MNQIVRIDLNDQVYETIKARLLTRDAFWRDLSRALADAAKRGVGLSLARFSFAPAVDRRTGMERRQTAAADAGYTGPERRTGKERRLVASLERRRGPGRRRSDERKSAEEGEMDAHQFEFVMAIETYKKVNRRLYPTWTEILEVVHQLGYRKVLNRTITLQAPEPELYDEEAA